MANYNRVLLMGNLTRDIELKATSGGTSVANIGMAVNRRYKNREGNTVDETTFVDCEAWGRTAEVMQQYLSKGRPVFIEGRLRLDQWEDPQGNKRSKMKVVVESFEFVDSGSGGGGGGGGGRGRGDSTSDAPQPEEAGVHTSVSEDDIPF